MPIIGSIGGGSNRGFGAGGIQLPEFGYGSGGSEQTIQTDYKLHTFTSSAQFVWQKGKDPTYGDKIEYLLVAGGGGGGSNHGGGGGGGGYHYNTSFDYTLNTGTYPVTVGAGGSGGVGSSTYPNDGENSSIGSLSASGGGAGGHETGNGRNGGSGGGAKSGNN